MGQTKVWSSYAENNLMVLVDTNLNMSQQCTLVAKVKSILDIRSVARVILALYSALLGYIWSALSSGGLPGRRETQTYWRESSKGPLSWLNDWSIRHTKRGWENWDCSAVRTLKGILSIWISIWREGAEKAEPGSFHWCPVTRWEATGTNWNTGGSLRTWGNFFLWGWLSPGTGCPKRFRVSLLGDTQNPSGHGPGQLTLGVPLWAEGLDKVTYRGPFQPTILWFCDMGGIVWFAEAILSSATVS